MSIRVGLRSMGRALGVVAPAGPALILAHRQHYLMPADEIKIAHMAERLELIMEDDFETWVGWNQYQDGTVEQSSEQAHGGTYSLKKDTNSDPHGGWKSLGDTYGFPLLFEGWIYRPSVYAGGAADRLAIEDSSFNGYGFVVDHGGNVIRIERRDGGVGTAVGSDVSWNPPENAWYQFKFWLWGGGVFDLYIYDADGNLVASALNRTDTAYTSFDRVVIHGGYHFYVDDLKVYEV